MRHINICRIAWERIYANDSLRMRFQIEHSGTKRDGWLQMPLTNLKSKVFFVNFFAKVTSPFSVLHAAAMDIIQTVSQCNTGPPSKSASPT